MFRSRTQQLELKEAASQLLQLGETEPQKEGQEIVLHMVVSYRESTDNLLRYID